MAAMKRWLFEGNVPVKVGMVVLLAGVAALLKYAADLGWFTLPMELRLAGVAAAAIAGLVFGWRQRDERRAFALALQGGAIGVLMLVVFAAFKVYGFIPAGLAFGVTIALVAGIGVLSVVQESRALAVLGILAGFLAPIWLSTGRGDHVALFSYYAVLNLGIFAIAWKRAWRELNLLGFVFTFAIGTAWGVLDYAPSKFATTEPFLVLFYALYLVIPVLYAGRRHARGERHLHRLVDGTLVFATPLVAFALQAALLPDDRMLLALSALAVAAVYAVLAATLRKREAFSSLADAHAVLAVGFATLSVPLALSASATASAFALEGAALVWLGLRQQRRLPQASGLLLQMAAAVAFLIAIEHPPVALYPVANGVFLGAFLIAFAGAVITALYRDRADALVLSMMAYWSLAWWLGATWHDVEAFAPCAPGDWQGCDASQLRWMTGVVLVTAAGAALAARRVAGLGALRLFVFAALAWGVPLAAWQSYLDDGVVTGWNALVWGVYAVAGAVALASTRDASAIARAALQGAWFAAWMVLAMVLLDEAAEQLELGEGWRMATALLPMAGLVALLGSRARWFSAPLAEGFDDYRRALRITFAVPLALTWCGSLFLAGKSTPLPWVPLLNPLELTQALVLVMLAAWSWQHRAEGSRRPLLVAFAAFAWITFATLRSTAVWFDLRYGMGMLGAMEAQTALTLVWSLLGVLGWVFGSRRGERGLWLAGALLMGVVLAKLLLVDREHLGTLFGIVSFLAYGLLCTAVGYFAPAPPRRAAHTEASP